MAEYESFTRVEQLERISNRKQLEFYQLDDSFASLNERIEQLTRGVYSSGGVVLPGTVGVSGTTVTVQNRLGVSMNARVVLELPTEGIDIAGAADGQHLIVIAPTPRFVQRNWFDKKFEQAGEDFMVVALGVLEFVEGGGSYPSVPSYAVPVAHITKSGSSVTIDEELNDPPEYHSDDYAHAAVEAHRTSEVHTEPQPPAEHAGTHATGQSDALEPSDIGAVPSDGGAMTGPLQMPEYAVSSLPTAGDHAGALVAVTDEVGGYTMAFSDGTNWRRVQDREVVSIT